MTDINPVLVEKYQLMLQSDPKAKVFAPLAEAYRRMGLIQEGIQIAERGVTFHPDFAGGRVALGRLYLDKGEISKACDQLAKAVELSPENLLALGLLGEARLKLRQPKEALEAYKMLLLFSPNDEKAQNMVRKLESLTADEYDEDVFSFTKLADMAKPVDLEVDTPEKLKPLDSDEVARRRERDLARYLSLADAFMVRNDFEKAEQTLLNAEKAHGPDPQVTKRLKLINQRHLDEEADTPQVRSLPRREEAQIERQLAALRELKARIEAHRRKT